MEKNMTRNPEADTQPNAEQVRKPYHKPEVVVYGHIKEITRNTGPKGNLDGGGGAAAGPKTGA